MPLLDGFFNPNVMSAAGAEGALLKYLSSDVSQSVDLKMVDSVRNILFGAPGSGAGGQDLFALDVERGRDVGLPTLNETRIAYGLRPYTSFAQITSDKTVQAELQSLYGTVDNVELFVGGLAENHAAGSSVGSTFGAIIADQFESVRDGDRLWYQNIFSGSDLRKIQNTTLGDLISANTGITNLQNDVFFFNTSISGHVLAQSGQQGRGGSGGQQGLQGVLVSLEDASGNVVDTTRTGANGRYVFSNVDLGTYHVVVSGLSVQAGSTTQQVSVTKGGAIASIDFDLRLKLLGTSGGGNSGGGNQDSGNPGRDNSPGRGGIGRNGPGGELRLAGSVAGRLGSPTGRPAMAAWGVACEAMAALHHREVIFDGESIILRRHSGGAALEETAIVAHLQQQSRAAGNCGTAG